MGCLERRGEGRQNMLGQTDKTAQGWMNGGTNENAVHRMPTESEH